MKLIFIHGREQESFEAEDLKKIWTDTLNEGFKKNGLTLPKNVTIEFPYFGKLLKSMADNPDAIPLEDIATRDFFNILTSEDDFLHDYLNEVLGRVDIAHERGLLNNETVQNLFERIDKIGFLGDLSLKKFTKDVYLYLTHSGIRKRINETILEKMDTNPCVVIGHSLGSIVSYDVLKTNPKLKVNKLITIGSPLGISSIRRHLAPPVGMPECVKNGWFNAYDERDFVALKPLDALSFPFKPPISNKNDVDNPTDNRHGIIGYLNDKVVAKTIYDALTTA
jgi:hypothetical protein